MGNSHDRRFIRRHSITPDSTPIPLVVVNTQAKEGVEHYSKSDKLAIALALIGVAVGIALLLIGFVVEKLSLIVPLLLALMAIALIYPVLHFVKTWLWRIVAFAGIALGIAALGALVLTFQKRPETPVQSLPVTVPDLAFSFRQIASNKTRPPLLGDGTTIIIIGNVLNNGKMPTSVREWSLKIVPTGEQSELAGALIGGNFTTLRMRSDTGQEENLSWKDDYLPEILARKSIGSGETIPGFVVFVVPNANFEKVKLKGTKYTFGFQDALGKQYSFLFVGKGGDQPAQYFPGLSRPSTAPPVQPTSRPTVIFKGTEIIGNGTVIQNADPNAHFEFDDSTIEDNGKVFVNKSQNEKPSKEQQSRDKP